jgi:hypothetical protein
LQFRCALGELRSNQSYSGPGVQQELGVLVVDKDFHEDPWQESTNSKGFEVLVSSLQAKYPNHLGLL